MVAESADKRMMRALRTLLRIQRILQQVCEEQGMTVQQYRTLTWLSTAYKARPHTLAEQAAISRPAAAAMVNGLQAKKLVKRKAVDEDGRGVYLIVTKKANLAIDKLEGAMTERMKQVFGESVHIITALAASNELDEALDGVMNQAIESGNADPVQ